MSKIASPEFLPVEGFGLDAFGENIDAEAGEDGVLEALNVPIGGMGFDRAELIHQVAENSGNIIF